MKQLALLASFRPTSVLLIAGLLMQTVCGGGNNNVQTGPPPPTFKLVKLSTDTLTNVGYQHASELETSTAAFGSTIVSSFAVARGTGGGFPGDGDVGFATSTDAGATWTSGYLSGLVTFMGGPGFAIGNASVAYDAAHQVWLIETILLPVQNVSASVVVVRSPDGINWNPNFSVVTSTTFPDKPWITCDNTSTSPFYGHCYVQWDTVGVGTLYFSTSTDGGLTWKPALNPAGTQLGGNAQPVVRPNGTVVVPLATTAAGNFLTGPVDISSIVSTDGGASWNVPVPISANVSLHGSFDFRMGSSPSVRTDGAGKVYAVWPDCSFRSGCPSNDLIISTSSDGVNWSTPARIPIDPVTSTADHFTPGLAVDPNTTGNSAHLMVTYYYYPQTNCTDATCQLYVGFVSSTDGGQTWSTAQTVAGPMSLSWLPETMYGRDVGDYTSSCYVNGRAFGLFPVAHANSGVALDQAIYTTAQPLAQ